MEKLFRIKFPTKKSVGAYVYLPPGVELGAPKIYIFEILQYTKKKKIHFRVERCQNY